MTYHIFTEIQYVHESVHRREEEDDPSHEFMKVEVLVERQERASPVSAEEGEGLSQHQHQCEHHVEVQALSCDKSVSFLVNITLKLKFILK